MRSRSLGNFGNKPIPMKDRVKRQQHASNPIRQMCNNECLQENKLPPTNKMQKSTGPRTEHGKHPSRRNAFRHGLTADTVIDLLEDQEDDREAAGLSAARRRYPMDSLFFPTRSFVSKTIIGDLRVECVSPA